MKVVKTEHHQVNSEFTYDIPDEDIIDTFGSVERFRELVSHMGSEYDTTIGDPPTDEEYDLFIDFFENYDYDRYDDWWTDRKGGYDVTYKADDSYDSDEVLLN